ncbi:hypothetical protein ACYSNW_14800 [Enterococcus sp. LJL99]
MIIFMCALAVITLVLLSYLLYIRLQLETLDSDSLKMKRKINFYKYQENNRSLVLLMITAIVFCLLFIGILYNQNTLRKDNKDLEQRLEDLREIGGTASAKIESYKEGSLKLAKFPWDKVVESQDSTTKRSYEIQLSRDLQPFFGEPSVIIANGKSTESLTISVFTATLNFNEYKTVEKNVTMIVDELNKVAAITTIDFNITYRDESNTLSKAAFVYSRNEKEDNLEKVELDK